jgi:hypothetical protein
MVPHHGTWWCCAFPATGGRLIKVAAGSVLTLGGIVGYALVDQLYDYLLLRPAVFIYVALADPDSWLQNASPRETAAQIAWLLFRDQPEFLLISRVVHAQIEVRQAWLTWGWGV